MRIMFYEKRELAPQSVRFDCTGTSLRELLDGEAIHLKNNDSQHFCTVCDRNLIYGKKAWMDSRDRWEEHPRRCSPLAHGVELWKPCNICTDPMDCGSWACCMHPAKGVEP